MRKIAVIGCGLWGQNIVRNFAELGVLNCVASHDLKRGEHLTQTYNIPVKTSLEIFNDPSIEGVVIATPAESHFALAREALIAGKHILVEKPLTLSSDKADNLISLAKKRNKTLMVGHILMYHPAYLKVKELTRGGTLGKLHHIVSHRLNLGRVRAVENVLWDMAPHDLSMILDLVEAPLQKVHGHLSAYLHTQRADIASATLSFANNINAHVFVSWINPFKEHKFLVIGDKAMVVFDDTLPWTKKLTFFNEPIRWDGRQPVMDLAKGESIPLQESEPLKLECQHFLDCIAGKATPQTDGQDGRDVISLLEEIEQSHRQASLTNSSHTKDVTEFKIQA